MQKRCGKKMEWKGIMNETEIKKLKTKFTVFIIVYAIILFAIIALFAIIIYRNYTANIGYKAEIERGKRATADNIKTIAGLNIELARERERNSNLAKNIYALERDNSQAQKIIDRIRDRNIQAILVSSQIKASIENCTDIYDAIEQAITAIEKIAKLLDVDGNR